MRLSEDERTLIDSLLVEAHRRATRSDGSFASNAVPVHFIDLLTENEGALPGFIGDYLTALALKGAAGVVSGWRRRLRVQARTTRGKSVEVPQYAGIRRRNRDGGTEYVQVPFEGLSVDELRAKRAGLEATRNTLSVQIQAYTQRIEATEAAERVA